MRIPWRISHCHGVEEAEAFTQNVDLIILKPEMEEPLTPHEVFDSLNNRLFEVPIIVLTSESDDHALTTFVMERGAADTVIRGQFTRLVDAVEFALIRQKLSANTRKVAENALLQSQEKSKTDLQESYDHNEAEQERHRQILRMFTGDYSDDPKN